MYSTTCVHVMCVCLCSCYVHAIVFKLRMHVLVFILLAGRKVPGVLVRGVDIATVMTSENGCYGNISPRWQTSAVTFS